MWVRAFACVRAPVRAVPARGGGGGGEGGAHGGRRLGHEALPCSGGALRVDCGRRAAWAVAGHGHFRPRCYLPDPTDYGLMIGGGSRSTRSVDPLPRSAGPLGRDPAGLSPV